MKSRDKVIKWRLANKEKKKEYDRKYRQKNPTSSNRICDICGLIGGGGTKNCINKAHHETILKSKLLISRMREESYLFNMIGTHTSTYKDLKKAMEKIEHEKGKPAKGFFRRKKNGP